MDLARHISPEQILVGIDVKDKWELLDRMIAAIGKSPNVTSQPEEVRKWIGPLILERERGSAWVGVRGTASEPPKRVRTMSTVRL